VNNDRLDGGFAAPAAPDVPTPVHPALRNPSVLDPNCYWAAADCRCLFMERFDPKGVDVDDSGCAVHRGWRQREAVDPSGVAGEPEATTKEAPQTVQEPSPTQVPVPDPVDPPASNVAGGTLVSDEAVEAFHETWKVTPGDYSEAVAAGLAAAAPRIAAQALRSAAGPLHRGHPTECPGCALVERADELERGTDR
jgi:hypothetical protein